MEAVVNHETVYDLLYRERWAELLDLIHTNRGAIEDDELLHHAVDTFAEVFFSHVDREGAAAFEAEIEKLFLLHVGGYHRLPAARFDRVVVHLVRLNADRRPAAAAGYARHAPEHAECAAAISRYDVRERAEHSQDAAIALDRIHAARGVDHSVPLFKSQQEEEFFLAARDVFATYLVYPNVALSTLFSFEALREALTPDERQFFFRGVIDCVVFDQQDGYRPLYFFEIDSPLHDSEERRERDVYKDRIISLAGKQLYRIRMRGAAATRGEIGRTLREVVTI